MYSLCQQGESPQEQGGKAVLSEFKNIMDGLSMVTCPNGACQHKFFISSNALLEHLFCVKCGSKWSARRS